MQQFKRRKKLLVNRPFQLSFLKHLIVIAIAIGVLVYVSNQYFFWQMHKLGLEQGLPADHIFFQFIEDQRIMMIWIFLATGVFVSSLLAGFGLYYSNRIAGPLLRLQMYFEKQEFNQPGKKLEFRKNDYFPELAKTINDCFAKTSSADKD
jgi:hypothetical protein